MLGPAGKSLYDVLGEAVNTASRMEAICPGGGVAVSPNCEDALKPWFRLEPLGEQHVKGIGRMACFNVAGLRPLGEDDRRVDRTSQFAADYLPVIEEVEKFKSERLGVVDFVSLQARDVALQHNEAVASYALALLRRLRAESRAGSIWAEIDEGPKSTKLPWSRRPCCTMSASTCSIRRGSTIAASTGQRGTGCGATCWRARCKHCGRSDRKPPHP
jgi:hypothetical protein